MASWEPMPTLPPPPPPPRVVIGTVARRGICAAHAAIAPAPQRLPPHGHLMMTQYFGSARRALLLAHIEFSACVAIL